MNSKLQEIITIPAMVVPSMSTDEIHQTILETSLEYVKGNLPLHMLIIIATKIQYFMGIRGEDSTQVVNMLSRITELSHTNAQQKKLDVFIESILYESGDSVSLNETAPLSDSSQYLQ